jgi:glutaredoxin 3
MDRENAPMSRTEQHESARPRILMYSTGFCPYCALAEQYLRRRGSGSIDKIRVDLDPARRNEMMIVTGKRTVPQIFIGDAYVGGYDELRALDRAGGLDALLATTAARAAIP